MLILLMDIILFLIGFYALVIHRNIIKKVIGFGIMEYAVNLLFVLIGYRFSGEAPIISPDSKNLLFVDPLPQALVLTSIVISLGVTALMVALCIKIYQHYGTFDIDQIRRLKG
ncbi:MAG: NADH-quinone oxidoreductase subunit K [Candidatus Omnitrophica bacterium]|jgi:multicomponent Na+:H+ antiporter subunit C|nr:NADH-quinone oxidoreductase subunit K [Candidatus Omnitrophota bacterium]